MTIPVTAILPSLDSALLAFLWQGLAMALLLWFALALLRRASANARYLASCIALAALALAPVVTAWLAYQAPAPVEHYALLVPRPAIHSGSVPHQDWVAQARAWMVPAWACGVFLLSLRLLWGSARVMRLKRKGEAPDAAILAMAERLAARLRVTRPVRVLVSSLADGPSVVGWLRPALLLPAATILGLSPEQLEAVLAHELAHIRRYDYLVNMVQMLIETLFFYHPAVWWISRRIRVERELCCDDVAVEISGDAVRYARALATLERMRMSAPGFALGIKDGPLLYRIERLLGVARREPAPSRLPGLIAVCLGLACLAPVVNPVRAQNPTVQAPQPPAAHVPAPHVPAPKAPASEAPRAAVQHVLRPARRPAMQVAANTQTGALSNAADNNEDVLVQVTIDQNGGVNDARVINGPMEGRRFALLEALNLRYPQNGPGTDLVSIPTAPLQAAIALVQPLNRNPGLQTRASNAAEDLARLKALQAQASDRGAAQIQEAINAIQYGNSALANSTGQDPLIGARLNFIRITGPGATGEARRDVLAQLPFRVGDTLSDASMRAAVSAVRMSYPSGSAYFGMLRDSGQGIFIVTLPPPAPLR